jgi:hypothetical protein
MTDIKWKSESKLRYDRRSVGQSVSVSSSCLKKKTKQNYYYCQIVTGLLMYGALSDERTGLSFTIAVGLSQRRHSRVRVPRNSWLYFTVSDSRLPQLGMPGPRIYIPQEQGVPVISLGVCFPSNRLLRLARIQWKYSSQSPCWDWLQHMNDIFRRPSLISLATDRIEGTARNFSPIVVWPVSESLRGDGPLVYWAAT